MPLRLRHAFPLFIGMFFLVSGCRPDFSKAPDFTLPTLSQTNENLKLSGVNAENPVLLVFWASWCPPCVAEIPTLNKWQETYKTKGLKILGVNVQESRQHVNAFKEKNPIHYDVVLDRDGEIADRFGIHGLPSAVLLAKGGEIVYYGFSLPKNVNRKISREAIRKNLSALKPCGYPTFRIFWCSDTLLDLFRPI